MRVAEGEVRCGNCTISFNALTELTDDLPELTDAVVPDTGQKPEATPDQALVAPGPTEVGENRKGKTQEPSGQADSDLEFDVPEVSWSNFFVSSDRGTEEVTEAADTSKLEEPDEAFPSAQEPAKELSPLELETADPDEWREFLDELSEADLRETEFETRTDMEEVDDEHEGDRHPEYDEDDDPTGDQPGIVLTSGIDEKPGEVEELSHLPDASEHRLADAAIPPENDPLANVDTFSDIDADDEYVDGPQIPPDAAHDLPAGSDAGEYTDGRAHDLAAFFDEDPANVEYGVESAKKFSWWSLAIIALLGIAFLGQLVHYNRDYLAAHPEYGVMVRSIYARIGSPLYPEWTLDAFRVRGTEAVAGRSSSSALDILATIEIVGPEPVGLPLVRIALQDRWANPVASRVFHPYEYLQADKALPDVVPTGTTLPVEVSVIDPGAAAQNYVIDVCIPSRSRGLQCQLKRNPFQS